MLNEVDEDAIANARLEEVITALENQDKDDLKALFSEQALNESNDFDVNMNQLFEFFKEKLIHGKNQVVHLCLHQIIMDTKLNRLTHIIL